MKLTQTIIPLGQALSNPINLRGKKLIGLIMPEAWTAAEITFALSVDGQNWRNVFNMSGAEVSIAPAASQYIVTDYSFPGSWDETGGPVPDSWWMRLRSGSSATPVVQTQETSILLVTQ